MKTWEPYAVGCVILCGIYVVSEIACLVRWILKKLPKIDKEK